MLILNSAQTTQETILRWKKEHKVALIPTMGCLHEAHLDLVRAAKKHATKIVVSIFVNPLQFGPNEDFDRYPRTFEDDKAKLEEMGVDLLFHPNERDLYPEGFSTSVRLGEMSEQLCGKFRPGHFDGVATVCLKLFNITQADYAVFGEKDFQQLRVVQQLTHDFNMPVTIVPHPTVRDTDGVALSSRNRYLSASDRESARAIPLALDRARTLVRENGITKVQDVLEVVRATLATGSLTIQYCEVTEGRFLRHADPKALVHAIPLPHLFIAVKIGATRLIDNVSLNGDHA